MDNEDSTRWRLCKTIIDGIGPLREMLDPCDECLYDIIYHIRRQGLKRSRAVVQLLTALVLDNPPVRLQMGGDRPFLEYMLTESLGRPESESLYLLMKLADERVR